jgi:hypothetical protein
MNHHLYSSQTLLLAAATLAACQSKWSTPHTAPGPVPLGPPGTPIARLEHENPTFEVTYRETLWDDGHGPVRAVDRVNTILNAAPKTLVDRLHTTRKALDIQGGQYDQLVYDAKVIIVSLNPDIAIVSLAERKPPLQKGDLDRVFDNWDLTDGRWQIIEQTLERGLGDWLDEFVIYAGPLTPWADEIYAFSPDPAIPLQRLQFNDNLAILFLPQGKLILRHHDLDVAITRE